MSNGLTTEGEKAAEAFREYTERCLAAGICIELDEPTAARKNGCVYCINCPEKITAQKKRNSDATETGVAYDNIKVNFCPMCGKRLEEKR